VKKIFVCLFYGAVMMVILAFGFIFSTLTVGDYAVSFSSLLQSLSR